jgi:putative ABC transport system substrate-binding protein
MQRRNFLRLAGGAAAWPLAARAQQPSKKMPLVGALWLGDPTGRITSKLKDTFQRGLREEGYSEATNIAIESRYYSDGIDKAASDLVGLNPDVIFVVGTPGIRAMKRATASIPIVGANMAEPVADGLVASLNRPGGNVTGNTFLGPVQGSKRLDLLRQLVPSIKRLAGLRHPQVYSERTMQSMLSDLEESSGKIGVEFQIFDASAPNDFEGAFEAMARSHQDAVIVFPSPMFYVNDKPLVDLPAARQLPAMYVFREAVEAGGLISYGADIPDNARLGAKYVTRILRGAKPGDLPVEQPTKYELLINLKAAKLLNISVPSTLIALADEVIE